MPPRRFNPVQHKSKIAQTSLTPREIATAPAPAIDIGSGNNRAMVYTYFTKDPNIGDPPAELYSGDRLWTRVTLTLETAGPVAVGTMTRINPVLSGLGSLLETGQPLTFEISKGTKLYIAATAVNRVKVFIQPVPWLEQITGLLGMLPTSLRSLFGK